MSRTSGEDPSQEQEELLERQSFVLLGGTGGAARAEIPRSVGGVSGSVHTDAYSVDPFLQPSLTYWGRAAKCTKEEILNRWVVCLKNKRGLEGSREQDVHHSNATKALAQTFGAAKHFVPRTRRGNLSQPSMLTFSPSTLATCQK